MYIGIAIYVCINESVIYLLYQVGLGKWLGRALNNFVLKNKEQPTLEFALSSRWILCGLWAYCVYGSGPY